MTNDDEPSDPATALRDAADLAYGLLADMHHPAITGSPYAADLTSIAGRFIADDQDIGEAMIHSIVNQAARYIAYVSRGARDLAAMIDQRSTVSMASVVRSHVEYAARAWWLVEPLAGDAATSARERAIRLNLDLYTSVCYQRFTLRAAGSPDAKAAKSSRDAERERIRQRYGTEPTLGWAQPGDERDFDIDGVTYEGLTSVTKRFLNSIPVDPGVGTGSSAYDALAGYSHPSPLFLQEMLTWITLDDRTQYHWDIDSDWVSRLAMYSEGALWHSTAALAKYVDRWEPAGA